MKGALYLELSVCLDGAIKLKVGPVWIVLSAFLKLQKVKVGYPN